MAKSATTQAQAIIDNMETTEVASTKENKKTARTKKPQVEETKTTIVVALQKASAQQATRILTNLEKQGIKAELHSEIANPNAAHSAINRSIIITKSKDVNLFELGMTLGKML